MIDDKQPLDLGIPHDTPIFRQPPFVCQRTVSQIIPIGCRALQLLPDTGIPRTNRPTAPSLHRQGPGMPTETWFWLHRSKEMVGSCEKNMGSDRLQWKKTHLTWCHMAKVVGPLVFIIALSIYYIPPIFAGPPGPTSRRPGPGKQLQGTQRP